MGPNPAPTALTDCEAGKLSLGVILRVAPPIPPPTSGVFADATATEPSTSEPTPTQPATRRQLDLSTAAG